MSDKDRYREAGVDIEKGNEFVRRITAMVQSTHTSAVLGDIGGFSGMVSLNTSRYTQPVLVSSTDGVGTKLKFAFMTGKHDTVGIDLVGMVVNDIVVCGARPLFMLDYLSTGKLELAVAEQIISGIVEGCTQAHCSLIGGETAEMPGFYPDGEYDMAGFAVGVVDREEIIDGSSVAVGSALVGMASSGLHSNGYSLVRKLILEQEKLDVDAYLPDLGATVGEVVLTPTYIYTEAVLNVRRDFSLHGVAHITGGGLVENVPRALPGSCQAVIRLGSWPVPPIFTYLKKVGKLSDQEMVRTFNNGVGMVLVVPGDQAEEVVGRLNSMNHQSYIIGEVVSREPDQPAVEFVG